MGKSSTSFKKGGVGYWRNKKRPVFSKEWKEKIKKSLMGNTNGFQKGNKRFSGNNNGNYKGGTEEILKRLDKNSLRYYRIIHKWVGELKGNPSKCEVCGTTKAKKFEWSNTDHTYKMVLEDYVRMCRKCHYNYDKKIFGIKMSKGTYRGKPIEEMTREELIYALEQMSNLYVRELNEKQNDKI